MIGEGTPPSAARSGRKEEIWTDSRNRSEEAKFYVRETTTVLVAGAGNHLKHWERGRCPKIQEGPSPLNIANISAPHRSLRYKLYRNKIQGDNVSRWTRGLSSIHFVEGGRTALQDAM